jgi:hypothetical protein
MILGSRYFGASYFAARYIGSVPAKEEIVIPPPVKTEKASGGRSYSWDGWASLLTDSMKRKKRDEEIIQILALFATLEDDDAGSI